MKIKYFVSFVILSFALIYSTLLFVNVSAQTNNDGAAELAQIVYPISELGNCGSEKNCKSYCDKPENLEVCLKFADQHSLMSREELTTARKFAAVGQKGPGGCTNKETCEKYCDNIEHINECTAFAEANGLISPEKLEEAKKIKSAIDRGIKPPACNSKKECDAYCDNSDHMEECIVFAEAAGFMPPKELAEAKKVLNAIRNGVKPPSCHGKEACDQYCSEESHFDECINFAAAAGFMDSKELEMAKKTKGKGPGGCRGKEECDAFCSKDENMQTCMVFAEENGLVSKEEADMMRKTGGKGPGDCKSKESCEAFCNDSKNQETCFNFAKERGMIPPEQLQQMEQGKQRFQESMNQAPPAVMNCLNDVIGAPQMDKFRSGAAMPPKEIGDKMKECFEKNMGPMPDSNNGQAGQGFSPNNNNMIGPGFSGGPGGCKNEEECKNFKMSNRSDNGFVPGGPGVMFSITPGGTQNLSPGGQMMQVQGGPGGCKGPEECRAYCDNHKEECKNFNSTGGQTGPSVQNFIQGVMQMMQPPIKCEGENCNTTPTPQNYASGTTPQSGGMILPQNMMQPGTQPPSGMQQPTDIMPPQGIQPPQGIMQPGIQSPPLNSQIMPPQNMISPQDMMQPSPPPASIQPPNNMQSLPPMPPSSSLAPNPFATLLISLFGVFLGK